MAEFDYLTKDSGQRREFGTGSVRDIDTGKPRFDLLGLGGLYRAAGVAARGCDKYGERNYEYGQPISQVFASMLRHAFAYWAGADDEDHVGAMEWNALTIGHMLWLISLGLIDPALDDMPKYKQRGSREEWQAFLDSLKGSHR